MLKHTHARACASMREHVRKKKKAHAFLNLVCKIARSNLLMFVCEDACVVSIMLEHAHAWSMREHAQACQKKDEGACLLHFNLYDCAIKFDRVRLR